MYILLYIYIYFFYIYILYIYIIYIYINMKTDMHVWLVRCDVTCKHMCIKQQLWQLSPRLWHTLDIQFRFNQIRIAAPHNSTQCDRSQERNQRFAICTHHRLFIYIYIYIYIYIFIYILYKYIYIYIYILLYIYTYYIYIYKYEDKYACVVGKMWCDMQTSVHQTTIVAIVAKAHDIH